MKICLIGGAGFIGTNLAIHLSQTDEVTVVDRDDKNPVYERLHFRLYVRNP